MPESAKECARPLAESSDIGFVNCALSVKVCTTEQFITVFQPCSVECICHYNSDHILCRYCG